MRLVKPSQLKVPNFGIAALLVVAIGAEWALWLYVSSFSLHDRVDFSRDIRPSFNQNCTACHGGVRQKNGVSFIYPAEVLGEGKSGLPIIVPGNPDASEVMVRVTSKDPETLMPYHAPPLSSLADRITSPMDQRKGAMGGSLGACCSEASAFARREARRLGTPAVRPIPSAAREHIRRGNAPGWEYQKDSPKYTAQSCADCCHSRPDPGVLAFKDPQEWLHRPENARRQEPKTRSNL